MEYSVVMSFLRRSGLLVMLLGAVMVSASSRERGETLRRPDAASHSIAADSTESPTIAPGSSYMLVRHGPWIRPGLVLFALLVVFTAGPLIIGGQLDASPGRALAVLCFYAGAGISALLAAMASRSRRSRRLMNSSIAGASLGAGVWLWDHMGRRDDDGIAILLFLLGIGVVLLADLTLSSESE